MDGGGTKTELILVDAAGEIVARHLAPGCNPSQTGPENARTILTEALAAELLAQSQSRDLQNRKSQPASDPSSGHATPGLSSPLRSAGSGNRRFGPSRGLFLQDFG